MKYLKFCAVIGLIVSCSAAGFCASLSSQGKYGTKLILQDANSVTLKANGASSLSSPMGMDPILNSQLNGMMNAVQGMQGNTSNIYSFQEQSRMQGEYAKQHANDSE